MLSKVGIHGHGYYELRGPDGELKQSGTFSNLITQVGDTYYGDRAAAIPGAALTTNAITNADPAVVTVTTPHSLAIGDVVTLAGVTAATTDLNGPWVVETVPNATSFGLFVGVAPGAVSDAAGTATPMRSLGKVTGMRYGTGTTAVAKTGAGAAIVTYVAASALALDANFPTSALVGSSRRIQYKRTWAAGAATSNAISEVVLTNEAPLTDAAGAAANTIARALLSPVVNKAAGDSLAVTWSHDLLGG